MRWMDPACGFGARSVGVRLQPDRWLPQLFETLQRQREVRPALGRNQRVDFVDDDRVDRAQGLARVGGQQEVERLGRRDQDVGRIAQEARALDRRRVARPNRDRRRMVGVPPRDRAVGDAGQRRAQVSFDVDRERLQRRDVQHAAALSLRRHRVEHQAVDAPEERGERLAAAGRRQDERRVAARRWRASLASAGASARRTTRGTTRPPLAGRASERRCAGPQAYLMGTVRSCGGLRSRGLGSRSANSLTLRRERGTSNLCRPRACARSRGGGPRAVLTRRQARHARAPRVAFRIAQIMGDSGEGLVDAEARIQEQIEEREAERRRRSGASRRSSTPRSCASSSRCAWRSRISSGRRKPPRIPCANSRSSSPSPRSTSGFPSTSRGATSACRRKTQRFRAVPRHWHVVSKPVRSG